MLRNTQIYTHSGMCTHTQIGHYWLSLPVHVCASTGSDRFFWSSSQRSDFDPSLHLRSVSVFLLTHDFTLHQLFNIFYFYLSSLPLSAYLSLTISSHTHTKTHTCTWPISSAYLIRQSANQGFVWHWLWISRQMGRWMNGVKPGQ